MRRASLMPSMANNLFAAWGPPDVVKDANEFADTTLDDYLVELDNGWLGEE